MKDKDLVCKECGNPREVGRRLCSKCNNKRVTSYPRYKWTKNCLACGNIFEAHRKLQELCIDCYHAKKELSSRTLATNNYISTNIPGKFVHRKTAEDILGRKLSTNEVIHHVDENPSNNDPTNLMFMSRSTHGKLHQFLDLQRVIIEKSINENQENCWNNLRASMTTAWCESTNAKVQKLSEIGQSAAEPLNTE